MHAVGLYLRSLRDQRGYTQSEAAALIGVNAKTVERWEAGSHEPKLSQLEIYVKALDGSLPTVIERLVGVAVDEEALIAVDLLGRLPPVQRRLLSELARELLGEERQ